MNTKRILLAYSIVTLVAWGIYGHIVLTASNPSFVGPTTAFGWGLNLSYIAGTIGIIFLAIVVFGVLLSKALSAIKAAGGE